MTAPHECPIPGPAADFAAMLAAQLPVIETARLHLRAPRLEDFDAWAEILCGRAGPHLGGPFDREAAYVEFLASCGTWLLRGHGVWAVEPKTGGDVLGFVLLGFEPGDLEPELGYLFRPSSEGQGFATEAASATRDWGIAALGVDRLVSYVDPENTASVRLAGRLGAILEGEHDGSQVWVHRLVQQADVSSRRKMDGRHKEDALKTSKRGE